MTVREIRDKDGNVVGTVTTYPDTESDRIERIRRAAIEAEKELQLLPRTRFGRRRRRRAA